jgi:hypothetical protein
VIGKREADELRAVVFAGTGVGKGDAVVFVVIGERGVDVSQNMEIDKVYNRYLCPDYSQHDCICRLLTSGGCLTCEKKICICDELVKADWKHSLSSFPPSFPMPSLFSDFDFITPPKTTTVPVTKTYTVVVAIPVNEQVENIKKVYSKKMVKLDRDLSQEVK